MQESKTWVIAVVALIIGAAIGYYSMNSRMGALTEQVSQLQSEIDEKSKLVEEQTARIKELEAASK